MDINKTVCPLFLYKLSLDESPGHVQVLLRINRSPVHIDIGVDCKAIAFKECCDFLGCKKVAPGRKIKLIMESINRDNECMYY